MDQKLVQKIYQTVTDDTILPELMKDFEHLLGGHSSALMVASPDQFWMHQTNLDPDIAELYNTHYGDQDVWLHRAEQKKVSGVISGLMGLADHSEFDPAYFNDILKASDSQDCLGAFLFGSVEDSTGFLTVYRTFADDPFQRSDIRLMEQYAGHLQHAFGMRSEFHSLSAETLKLKTALSQINGPVMFLREDGTLAWANAQAEAELSSQSVIKIQSGRLCAANPHFAANLAAAVRSVFQLGIAATLPISVNEQGRPSMLYIAPLTAEISDGANKFTTARKNSAMVLVKLKPPPAVSAQAKAVLQSFFALTDRQTDIAIKLVNGATIADIAERDGRSIGTVRNHVKAVFEKTGTSRQAELVKLVLAL